MADQAGDASLEFKYTHDFHREGPRFTYSLLEGQIQKLKHSLEHWKEVVLHGKKVFLWEKQWHPTALIGGSTIFFTFLWLLDPSILTVISVFGLVFTLCDYVIPSVANSLFKPEKWTARKEQEFEELCTNIVLYKARMEMTWARYYKLKETNRKLYFGLTMLVLGVLTWIGCTFNNLFLAYVLVTFLLLLPGMEHNGINQKWTEYVRHFLAEVMRQKPKTSEKRD